MPGLTIGDTIPDLEVETTHGLIRLHDFVGETGWAVIFSHPGDFTPVCTTELGKIAAYEEELNKRGVKLLGLSCDDVQSHKDWIKDIEAYTPGCKVNYPIIADPNREVIKKLNMVDPDEKDCSGKPVPSRALHIVGPDKKIKLSFLYPATTGRNMEEVVRVVESLQKAAKHKVSTPVDWKPGQPVVISAGVSNEKARKMFPQGFEKGSAIREGISPFYQCLKAFGLSHVMLLMLCRCSFCYVCSPVYCVVSWNSPFFCKHVFWLMVILLCMYWWDFSTYSWYD